MTSDDFRRLALEMAGAIERSHMNHPDFRAHGRIFATLHHNDEWGMVKVTPEEQRELMRAHPAVFVPSAGAWGRQGCTNVRLAAANERTVRAAMLLAWENSAGKKLTKGRAGRVQSSTKERWNTKFTKLTKKNLEELTGSCGQELCGKELSLRQEWS